MFADPSGEEPSMQFSVRAGVGVSGKTECAIIPLFADRSPKGITADFDHVLKGQITRLVRQGRASSDPGQCLLLHDVSAGGARNLLLLGCGKRQSFGTAQLAKASSAAAEALSKTGIRSAVSN
jgi:leucyl aminopeptidase